MPLLYAGIMHLLTKATRSRHVALESLPNPFYTPAGRWVRAFKALRQAAERPAGGSFSRACACSASTIIGDCCGQYRASAEAPKRNVAARQYYV